MALNFRGLLPSNILSQSNYGSNKKFLHEGYSPRYLIYNIQNYQSHQKQGKFKKLSQLREASGEMITKYVYITFKKGKLWANFSHLHRWQKNKKEQMESSNV